MARQLAIYLKDEGVRANLIAQLEDDASRIRQRYERQPRTAEVEARLKRLRLYEPEHFQCPRCWDQNVDAPVVIPERDNGDDDDVFRCSVRPGHEWRVAPQ